MGTTESLLHEEDLEKDFEKFEKKSNFNADKEYVKKKIINSTYYHKKFKEEIEEISSILSNKKLLLETYLNTDWISTHEFQTKVEKVLNMKTVDDEEDKPDTPTLEDIKISQFNKDFQLDNQIRIKFIVAEILRFRKRKFTKAFYFDFLAPIVSSVYNRWPEYGLYHLALQIGPWLIEYNSSGLCIPRKVVSTAAVMSHDVGTICSKKNVIETVDKLADCIIKWNTRIEYIKSSGDFIKNGNCQDFIFDVLRTLDIKLDLSTPVKMFLERLITDGDSKLEFRTNEEFDKTFKLDKERSTVFETHLELDDFVLNLFRSDPFFNVNYKSELGLLKSFDRAFWMKNIRFPNDKRFLPKRDKKVDEDGNEYFDCACPFSDPRNTKSFIYVKNLKDCE